MMSRRIIFRLPLFFCLALAANCFGQSVARKTPRPVSLNVPLEEEIAAGETKTFALHLEANQFAELLLEQKGVDATLAADDAASGERLLEVEVDFGNYGYERGLLAAGDKPRDLLVRVFPAKKTFAAGGKFSLALRELKATDERDKRRINAQQVVLSALKLLTGDKTEAKLQGFLILGNALKLARESGDSILEATALIFTQTAYLELGQYDKSVEFGKTALPLLKGKENIYFQVYVRQLIGNALNSIGEAAEAIKILNESLRQAAEFGDDALKVNLLVNLSYAYRNLNDSEKCLESAGQALLTAEKTGDKQSLINALSALVYDYVLRGDSLKVIENLDKISLIGKAAGIDVGWIYNSFGLAYSDLGQLQKSLEYFQQSLDYERRTGEGKYNEAMALINISKTFARLGQTSRAVNYSEQAIELLNALNYKSATRIVSDLKGENYLWLKEYEKAKEIYGEILKTSLEEKPLNLFSIQNSSFVLGRIERKLGHPEAALEHYLKAAEVAKQLKSSVRTAISGDQISEIYLELGQLDKASETAQQVLELARESGDRTIESNALYTLARARRNQKNPNAALKLIEDSLKIVEAARGELISEESRRSYVSTVRDKYDFYIELLIELGSQPGGDREFTRQAFAATERARARSLLDLLAESFLDINAAGIKPELKTREQTNQAKLSALQTQLIRLKSAEKIDDRHIAELQKEIEKTDDEREALESEIRRSDPRYAALKYPTTLDLAQTQKLLDDQTVLLEYQTSVDASFLFAVGKHEFQIARLPNDKTLRQSVETLRRGISAPSRAELSNYLFAGRELYKTLLAPVENLLKSKTKIIVAADGALNYLPFEVLLTNNAEANLDKLPYLVRNFEISYTPSASVLANLNAAKKTPAAGRPSKSFLAFAAPDYAAKAANSALDATATRSIFGENRRWNLTDLKNAKTEAESIARLFPAGQSAVFTGAEATEERAESNDLLSQFRYIHFAVHGLIDEQQPQFSSLVLSLPKSATEDSSTSKNQKSKIKNQKSVDGLLQTPEIFNLHLNADLVTLSACETGLGQEVRGEGIVGLTRAFFYAGTPSVLVSLWKVDDASTAELMTGFYEQLRKTGERDKADALRQAQLKMIGGNRYAHPFYWASFVLHGKTDSSFK